MERDKHGDLIEPWCDCTDSTRCAYHKAKRKPVEHIECCRQVASTRCRHGELMSDE